jgi:hypothetical protein
VVATKCPPASISERRPPVPALAEDEAGAAAASDEQTMAIASSHVLTSPVGCNIWQQATKVQRNSVSRRGQAAAGRVGTRVFAHNENVEKALSLKPASEIQ